MVAQSLCAPQRRVLGSGSAPEWRTVVQFHDLSVGGARVSGSSVELPARPGGHTVLGKNNEATIGKC